VAAPTEVGEGAAGSESAPATFATQGDAMREGARRGRRRGRRGRRGGNPRDIAAGAGLAGGAAPESSGDSDDAFNDPENSVDEAARSEPALGELGGAPGTAAADLAYEPPPPTTGSFGWTGLTSAESPPLDPAPPSEAAPLVETPVTRPDATPDTTPDAMPVATSPEPPIAAPTETPTEKKVVWSSSPSSGYSSFGGGSRRDDY
jgi:hypothetical protein